MRKPLFFCLIMVLLLTACGREPTLTPIVPSSGLGGSASRGAAYQVDACPSQGFGAQGNIECGFLTVPEDRSLPQGKTIRLAVTILKNTTVDPGATAVPRQPDPLLLLVGTAGGGTRFVRGMASALGDVLAGRALILMDQRGTGRSEPVLDCPELGEALNQHLDRPMFSDETITQAAGLLLTCRQRWTDSGVALQGYTSEANAADLEDLRQALGYEQWNVYANGYGAHLVYLLMRDHPASLRSVVIESSPPEDAARLAEQAANLQSALGGYFALCAQDKICNETYPNLEARFYRMLDSLNAAPQTLEVLNTNRGERNNIYVDGNTLLQLTINSLANWDERVLTELPRVISQLESGQTGSLKTMLGMQMTTVPFSSSGLNWMITCTETMPLLSEEVINSGLDEVQQPLASYYRRYYAAQRTACTAFDGLQGAPPRLAPVNGGAPTLAVVTRLSPASSLAWTESATSKLSTRWIAEITPTGGQSGGLQCARGLLQDFLASPSSEPEAACANQSPTLRWITFQQ